MSVIVLLVLAGGLVAAGFVAAFAWAVWSGQFDDLEAPPLRVAAPDDPPVTSASPSESPNHP